MLDFVRGVKTGRLLQYDPSTGKVTILATGIHFANGISIDKEETILVFAETFGARIWKYHLNGEHKGQLEVLAENLPGTPDGLDCSHENGKCYAVLPSSKSPSLIILDYVSFPL